MNKLFFKKHTYIIKNLIFFTFVFFISCDNEPDSDLITWQKNWNTWNENKLSDYSFNFRASCYCIDEWVSEVKVTVSSGNISKVILTKNNSSPTKLKPEQWFTIDQLFDYAKNALEQAYKYDIKYDASFGYPTEIFIDWSEDTADDEVIYYSENLTGLK